MPAASRSRLRPTRSSTATASSRSCWPGAGSGERFVFKRLTEIGDDQVLVTYERTRNDGGRGRNTEILTFDGDQIVRAEVYFGWNLA